MKKLNNKGYLLVEIIVAIVLAMGIAYFLMNITIKFSQKDEDIYQSISWINDKNILTNIIMEDLEKHTLISVKEINKENKTIEFTFADPNIGNNGIKQLIIDKKNNKIIYDNYEKQINKSLTILDIIINIDNNNKYTEIKIPITSIYSGEDYGIKLFFLLQ